MEGATSYQDLLKNFQKAEGSITERAPKTGESKAQKLIYRPMRTKQSNRSNKENFVASKMHTQSAHENEKSHTFRSEWTEDDVLKQYNEKRKDKQLQLTYNKFITYITEVLSQLTGSVPPDLLVLKITYLQYLAALKELSMIKQNYEPYPDDSVTSLWHELVKNGQSCGVLILFTAGILNMRKGEETNNKYSYLGKKYVDLRYTRMEVEGKVKTCQEEEDFSFTPSISQKSRTLAASRSKSKHKKSTKCFAQQSLMEDLQIPAKEYCPSDTQAGNRRSEILYQMARQRSLEKKRDKKSSEVEYEKSIQQLTFHPKIHPNTGKKSSKAIQGEQDSINRMIRGRVEREVRKIIHQKGLPYNEKMFEKMKKERYEAIEKQRKGEYVKSRQFHLYQEPAVVQSSLRNQNIPQISMGQSENKKIEPIVLTIEVDEDRCQKLVIEDPSKYKEAAAKFIQDLNLKEEMYDKLIEGVQKALKFQLTQVDEDSCQSEYSCD